MVAFPLAMSPQTYLLVLTCVSLGACARPVPPLPPAPCTAASPTAGVAPTASAVRLVATTPAPYHEAFQTKLVTTWEDPLTPTDSGWDAIGQDSASNGGLRLPRSAIFEHKASFPVDLDSALDGIHAHAQKVLVARDAEMRAELARRQKTALATPGSTLVSTTDLTTVTVLLAKTGKQMVFVVRRTLEVQLLGPMQKAPPANCLPGQPCAQMADFRAPAFIHVRLGARYTLNADGALVEETVFAPTADGPS